MAASIADLLIYESGDGGEFSLKNDDLETVSSITNQVYLAFFGGNLEQDTSDIIEDGEERSDWWGNELLDIPFNSKLERTLNNVALNSSGLRQIENAAKEDLKYLTYFADIIITASIESVNKLNLLVQLIEPDNQSFKIKFVWDNLRTELIEERVI